MAAESKSNERRTDRPEKEKKAQKAHNDAQPRPIPVPLRRFVERLKSVPIDEVERPSTDGVVAESSRRTNVTERWISEVGGISSGLLSFILRGERDLPPQITGKIARTAIWGLNLASRKAEVSEEEEKRVGYRAAAALIGELDFWRHEYDALGAASTREATRDVNHEVRAPIVRRTLFRNTVQEVLYGDGRVLTFHPPLPEENEENQEPVGTGKSLFALAIAQYVGLEAPPDVRRTLRVVSLAPLAGSAESADHEAVARWVGESLELPTRSLFDRYQAIAEYLRTLPRPLLLLKNTDGLPQESLFQFTKRLLEQSVDYPDIKIALVSKEPLAYLGEPEAAFRQKLIPVPKLDTDELVDYLRWRARLDLTPKQRTEMEELFALCDPPELRAAVGGAFATIYLLDSQTSDDPWNWFGNEAGQSATESPAARIKCVLQKELPLHNEADWKTVTLSQLYQTIVKLLRRADTAAGGREASSHGSGSVEALIRLCIFPGSFSKEAARACLTGLRKKRSLAEDMTNSAFERTMDLLCYCGVMTFERPDPDTISFSIPNELRDWIRSGGDPLDASQKSFGELRLRAEKRYLGYIYSEAQEALDVFDRDPHAIDPASERALARLRPELANIAYFLNRAWAIEKENKEALPIPLFPQNRIKGIESERDQQIASLCLLIASLAALRESYALFGNSLHHISQGVTALTAIIERTPDQPARRESLHQLRAIRGQLQISRALILMRAREQNVSMEQIALYIERGREDAMESGYSYGTTAAKLAQGMMLNRTQGEQQGLDLLEEAVREAREMANRFKQKEEPSLIILRHRLPLARNLAFTCQRELVRAQLRVKKYPASLENSAILLQAAVKVRETRLVADALLAHVNGLWCRTTDEHPEEPFPEDKLGAIRDLLFQAAPYIEARAIHDRESLRGHSACLTGIYMTERAQSMKRSGSKDYLKNRDEYGRNLFRAGYAMITDVHYRGVYSIFLADAFRRSLVPHLKNLVERETNTEPGQDRLEDLAIANGYLARGIDNLFLETQGGEKNQNDVMVSQIVRDLVRRYVRSVGAERVEIAIRVYILATTNNAIPFKQIERDTINPRIAFFRNLCRSVHEAGAE